ncbi:MAG: glycosyltransferase family 4 protein [Bryobacterales bacterium]|nr:glycosyltransferase family 4 protein [Bryobacterales bacterium]
MLRALAQCPEVDLKAYFLSGMSTGQYFDRGFGRPIEWDVPLVEGYRHEFLSNRDEDKEASRFRYLPLIPSLRRDRIQVLWMHGWMYSTNLMALLRGRSLGLRLLLRGESKLGNEPANPLKRSARQAFLRWCLSRVDGCLCIGRQNREFYRRYGVPEDRLFDVPYAVDNEFFRARVATARGGREAFRRSLGLDPGRPVILFAGKLVPHKGPALLLEAYRRLSPGGGVEPKPYLLFVGDGPLRASLEQQARETGWGGIRFAGFRNQTELPAFFDLCDVFVLPSTFEPWGLIVNEVMNAAKPVLVSDCAGCAADLVVKGLNGFVFPSGDVGQLSDQMRKVISDTALRESMGRASLERIDTWSFREDLRGILTAVERVMS